MCWWTVSSNHSGGALANNSLTWPSFKSYEFEKDSPEYVAAKLVNEKFKSLNKNDKINYHKQVCIYAFNKHQLRKFVAKNKKSPVEKIEDIEILRFFDYGIKIKMVKLNSNSVAVDELKDVKKAEKILKKKNRWI